MERRISDHSERANHQAVVSQIMSIHPQHNTALSFLIHRFYVSPLEPNAHVSVQSRQAIQAAFLVQVPWRSCKFIFDLWQRKTKIYKISRTQNFKLELLYLHSRFLYCTSEV